jgi:hypothetical protein
MDGSWIGAVYAIGYGSLHEEVGKIGELTLQIISCTKRTFFNRDASEPRPPTGCLVFRRLAPIHPSPTGHCPTGALYSTQD